jgi:PKD repeat protein
VKVFLAKAASLALKVIKRYLVVIIILSGCIHPTEPTEVHPPLLQIPNDVGAPIANFTITCENRICLFDAIDSKQTDLPIKAYGWSFGDASVRVMPSDIPSVQHTYKEKGSYEVMLTVWDSKDRGGRIYRRVIIE